MDMPVLIETPFRLALLLAGLLVPGSFVLRALRLPWSLAAAFLTSSAVLYVVVLVFACTGFKISLLTLAAALVLVTAGVRLVPARPSASKLNSSFSCFTRMGPWLPLYLAFWLVAGFRLLAQPLSGPDVYFRWSWLAERMLQFGTLDFYPPHHGADFVRYFWAESYPPGIASLYAWSYACAGSTLALWTSPVVALQLFSLHELIWRLGSRWGGEFVARRAVLLAVACPLLTWSVLIGQETGLLAVAVVGIAWCLHHMRIEHSRGWTALAGIFAAVGASTREYGPVIALTTVAVAWSMQLPKKRVALLAAVALPLALVWPLRVLFLTGNPVYSLSLGGLLPVNRNFVDWNDLFRGAHGFSVWSSGSGLALGRYLVLWALPAAAGVVALVVLLSQRLAEARVVGWFVAVLAVLWFLSVFYTAGGLFYSLRVLSPAFALLTVVTAYSLGLFIQHPQASRYGAIAIAMIAIETLPKTLVLPENPYRIAWREWPQAGMKFMTAVREEDKLLVDALRPLPGRDRILTDNAGLPRVLAEIGTEAVPLWTPDAAWLFDSRLKPQQIAQHWQQSGFRYLVLTKSEATTEFIRTHARWRAPYFVLNKLVETDSHIILEASTAGLSEP